MEIIIVQFSKGDLRRTGSNAKLKCLEEVWLSKSYVGLSAGSVQSTPGSVTPEFRERLVMAVVIFV